MTDDTDAPRPHRTHRGEGDSTGRFRPVSGALIPQERAQTPQLVVVIGQNPGRRFPLLRPSVLIGRSDECDVQLDDSKISRRHAQLTQRDDATWVLEDLGSRNGTLVNGERAAGPRALGLGDRVQLSPETLLVFTRHDPLADRLLHRQQMEVIGQLAAGIAHDFNNLLNVISAGMAHLATLEPSTPLSEAEVRECHDDVRAAAERAAELTGRLLTIARRRDRARGSSFARVDVSRLCEDALQLLRRTLDRTIRVESRVDRALFVEGDHAALHQLLMNLCINARDAMPKGGTLSVSARAERVSGAPAPWSATNRVVISVTDTGIGMDEETRGRVFEPFFTTKENGSGNGLGLATVYEVATSHGGFVDVESVLGQGSTFRVHLPAHLGAEAERANERGTTTDRPSARQKRGRVLVVDDQDIVRRSIGRLVRGAGHEVIYARDGRDGIDAYLAADPRPDVVILDLDMPHVSGADALAHLREIDPRACVVLVSGYYDEALRRRLIEEGALEFLGKPVDPAALRDAIERGLATAR